MNWRRLLGDLAAVGHALLLFVVTIIPIVLWGAFVVVCYLSGALFQVTLDRYARRAGQ